MKYCFAAVAALVMLVSCDQIIGGDGKLIIDPVEDALLEQTVGSTALAAEGVTFTTTGAWTSQVVPATKGSEPMWVSISPDHGDEAGTYTITISLEANDTGEDRKADIIITCGAQKITISITQVATEDVPSNGGDVQNPKYKKYVSKVEYAFTDWDGEGWADELTYLYDNDGRVARVKRVYSRTDDETVNRQWDFDYSMVGVVEVVKQAIETESLSESGYTVTASLDDSGRVSSYDFDNGYESEKSKTVFTYNSSGYLSGFYVLDSYDEERTELLYTDGLLSGIRNADFETDDTESIELNTVYANKYANDKINIDLNPFIMSGRLDFDEMMMWLNLRMAGKFSDCLMEIGEVFDDESESVSRMGEYTTPNVTIPVKYTTVMLEDEDSQRIVWTFDEDDCPLTATETFNYQEYEVTYDIVVGNTVIYERPDWDPETETEVMVKYYDYTTTPKQYTKTANSWSCPKVLKVTYRE